MGADFYSTHPFADRYYLSNYLTVYNIFNKHIIEIITINTYMYSVKLSHPLMKTQPEPLKVQFRLETFI